MSANFYELQKFAHTGIASADMTAFDKARALAAFGGGAVQTLTDVPPLSFKANGKPLISWSMLGNGQQIGTPTPDNLIMPTFCGVRTGNLWSEEYAEISGSLKYKPIFVGDGTFTMSTSCPVVDGVASLFFLAGNVQSGASTASNGVYKNRPITVASISGYVTIVYRYILYQTGTADPRNEQTMLNLGSTALPYEPFGWAEKITCAGQTVPVYLGQVSTVRRIKKLVLTGEEDFNTDTYLRFSTFIGNIKTSTSRTGRSYCSHYECLYHEEPFDNDWNNVYYQSGSTLYFHDKRFTTANDFKAYLAQQYANGTPVTIWYVLATPTTGIVNEPLAKIGDYADELRSEDAGVMIPTVRGQNTLTVDTDLQPSEMTITYKG